MRKIRQTSRKGKSLTVTLVILKKDPMFFIGFFADLNRGEVREMG
jgi:hypothetical protein